MKPELVDWLQRADEDIAASHVILNAAGGWLTEIDALLGAPTVSDGPCSPLLGHGSPSVSAAVNAARPNIRQQKGPNA